MRIEQIYTGCLSQGAYYIMSKGEVAIIDPLREVDAYIEKAAQDNAVIKYVFETHFHADFVSGHVTLSKKTGAPIVYGPTASPTFDALIAKDNQEFNLGDITIKVLHTPGHTMESTTYLILDKSRNPHAIFTGDTLFLGDVGRPDLAQKQGELTSADLAGYLYDSLREKIMPLPDTVMVYPGHGAGSACGKKMMKQTVDTLGNQKQMNYALRPTMTKQEFITEVLDGLTTPPAYFPLNVALNKKGYADVSLVLERGTRPLSVLEFEQIVSQENALILDVRASEDFKKSHIPGAIFIGIDGGFAPWVGAILQDTKQPLVLVCPEGREKETVTRLSRVGFDGALGFLQGGLASWIAAGKPTDHIDSISAMDLAASYKKDASIAIYDVRAASEYISSHIQTAKNTPLQNLHQYFEHFTDTPFYMHCAAGYRSVIAASILKRHGIHHMIDVQGGFGAVAKTDITCSDAVCPSTLKNQTKK